MDRVGCRRLYCTAGDSKKKALGNHPTRHCLDRVLLLLMRNAVPDKSFSWTYDVHDSHRWNLVFAPVVSLSIVIVAIATITIIIVVVVMVVVVVSSSSSSSQQISSKWCLPRRIPTSHVSNPQPRVTLSLRVDDNHCIFCSLFPIFMAYFELRVYMVVSSKFLEAFVQKGAASMPGRFFRPPSI